MLIGFILSFPRRTITQDVILLRCKFLDALDKIKVTGISQIDNLQNGVNNLIEGQIGKEELLASFENAVSEKGVNCMKRGEKDEQGTYGDAAALVTDPMAKRRKRS